MTFPDNAQSADTVAMLPTCPHPDGWLSWAKDRPVYCGRCQRSLTEDEIATVLERQRIDGGESGE